MADWLDSIGQTLEALGRGVTWLQAGDAEVLVTHHAARVLAARLDGSENLFYHDPALEAVDTAADAGITGGDRLWIAPEVAYYWPSLDLAREDPGKHAKTPAHVDPGTYGVVDVSDRHVVLACEAELTDSRSERTIRFSMFREVRVCDPPAVLPDGVACGSFAITNTLSLDGDASDPRALAGAWDILQLPTGGTLICPTVRPLTPDPSGDDASNDGVRSYYDPFGDHHVQADDHAVRFLIDGQRRTKMGIRAEDTTGRMGYFRRLDDGSATLVFRGFPTLPGEPYVDVPRYEKKDTRTGGDCLQAYNDDGSNGSAARDGWTFGEMEYHDPALIAGESPGSRSGTCVTHLLRGDAEAVKATGEMLLGVAIEPIT